MIHVCYVLDGRQQRFTGQCTNCGPPTNAWSGSRVWLLTATLEVHTDTRSLSSLQPLYITSHAPCHILNKAIIFMHIYYITTDQYSLAMLSVIWTLPHSIATHWIPTIRYASYRTPISLFIQNCTLKYFQFSVWISTLCAHIVVALVSLVAYMYYCECFPLLNAMVPSQIAWSQSNDKSILPCTSNVKTAHKRNSFM